jgi:hypothetical protein
MPFFNYKPKVSTLFRDIIENDRERMALRDLSEEGLMLQGHWRRVRHLVVDRKWLRSQAERALGWNTDKGSRPPRPKVKG